VREECPGNDHIVRKGSNSTGGFALFIIALLITLIIEVPIDDQIQQWTVTSLPANWRELRDRWELFHVLRSWISVFGLALLLIGALLTRDNFALRQSIRESETLA
jgi:hypothetical protein